MDSGEAGGAIGRDSVTLLGIPLVATILIAVIRGSRHFGWDWPVHAHHHLMAHIAGAVGLAVVSLLVLALPMRRGEGWALGALAVAGVAIFGGYWLGNATVGLGLEDSTLPNVAQGTLSVVYVAGLALAARQLGRRSEARSSFAAGDRR